MISKNYVFKISLAFVLGIFLAKFARIDWILAFTIWSFAIVSMLLLVYFGRVRFQLRRTLGFSLLIVFFVSGILGYSGSLIKNIDNHFYKHFLPKDRLIGSVIEFEKGTGKFDKIILDAEHVLNDYRHKPVEGQLLCYVEANTHDVGMGNKLIVSPRLVPIKNKNNPGEFDAKSYWETQGITEMTFLMREDVDLADQAPYHSTFWYDIREYFKTVLKHFVSHENLGVASALVLGDKSSLTKEKRAIFANSGAMHVLAVSGMHVGILLGFLQFIFFRVHFLRKRNLYIYFALFVVWCFAFLTGLSASVFRASIMFTVLAIGQLRGYSFFSLNALLFSGLLLLIIDANYLFNIGFQLSFLAMLGIVFFYRKIRDLLHIKNKWINYFWEGTSIGIAAQIGTVPISLYYFHQFPNYFVLTNIGLLILAGAALISAILLFVFHAIPIINELISKIVDFVFYILNEFVTWINALPYSVSTGFDPNWIHVLLLYLSILSVLYFSFKRDLIGFRTSTVFLFVLCVGLIYERELNKELQELVVFNNYNKTVALKDKNHIYCFFNENEAPKLEKTEFLVSGYGKQMGCDIQYLPVKMNSKVVLNNQFKLTTSQIGWDLTYFESRVCLVDKIVPITDSLCIKVGGYWNKYISKEKIDASTFRSAFVLQPEKKY